jgi:ABC-2 type transport system ATP-binding protein
MNAAVETVGLGKVYGETWALRDCSLTLDSGRVVGLVGPNGAGKTTLLSLVMGLASPSTGFVTVADLPAGSAEALGEVAFLSQEHQLYRRFRVSELLRMGASLNPRWDHEWARARLARLDIPLARRAGRLSGGQQAQVALTLALAKGASVILLDEPVASLDPLARRDFMADLMATVADTGATVVLSSHVVAELERVCDYMVLLSQAEVQLAGDVAELLDRHRRLVGPSGASPPAEVEAVVERTDAPRQTSLIARISTPVADPAWEPGPVSLEDLALAYLGAPGARWSPTRLVAVSE